MTTTIETDIDRPDADIVQPSFDSALVCFILLAKFLGVSAEPQQIAHDRGKGDAPYRYADLTRIARKLGLVAKTRLATVRDLVKLPLPAIAVCVDGSSVILLKADTEAEAPRFLLQRPGAERPDIWSEAEARDRLSGEILLLTSREKMAGVSRALTLSSGMGQPSTTRHRWRSNLTFFGFAEINASAKA